MANRIQLRRDTADNWTRVNPILDDGEPGLEIDTNKIKYGDGNTAWLDLLYAGFTDVEGVVAFPGDLLIGTLWPEDPMPEGDKESVIWAKDDTEYLGLWWGGDQTYPESGYGPVAGIMIGTGDPDMTDDFTGDPSPADTNITIAINDSTGTTLAWVFDRDGNLTLPTGGHIGPGGAKGEGTTFGGLNNHFVSLTSYYDSGLYSSCVTANADGSLYVTTYNDGGANPSKVWTYGLDGELSLPTNAYTEAVIKELDATALVLFAQSTGGNIKLLAGSTSAAGAKQWLFNGTDGTLTLPLTVGGGNEGAEIDFTKAPNSTLSGNSVIVDQYIDRLRFFEGGGTSRGAYIDLKQAAAGVGTLLNNRVSAFVNAGAFVTMDLLKATVTTTSNRGLSLAATTGSFVIYIAGTYAKTSTTGGAMAEVTLTTTPEASMFDWDFGNAGDSSTYIITDTTNNRSYRITLQIGYLYNNNMICIERLI